MEGLMDAYIPMKRNELGKRFSFLRFKNVQNEVALVQKINNTRIEGLRISANISKYRRDVKTDFTRKEQSGKGDMNSMQGPRMAGLKPIHNNFWTGDRKFSDVVRGSNGGSELKRTIIVNLGNYNTTGLINLAGRVVIGSQPHNVGC